MKAGRRSILGVAIIVLLLVAISLKVFGQVEIKSFIRTSSGSKATDQTTTRQEKSAKSAEYGTPTEAIGTIANGSAIAAVAAVACNPAGRADSAPTIAPQ